jgi:centriolar protein POC1
MIVNISQKPCPSDPELKRTFKGPKSWISAVEIHPSQKNLLCGSEDSSLTVYNFNPNIKPIHLEGHTGAITDACYSPVGTYIASSSTDKTIKYWQNEYCLTLKHHTAAVRSVCFSCDGKLLLSSSDDTSVKIWNTLNRKVVCSFAGHSNWVRSARFSPDARFVVSGGNDKLLRLWDVETAECLSVFPGQGSTIKVLKYSPDGSCIGVGDKKFRIWDIRSKQILQQHDINISSLSFHPSGNYILTSGTDGAIKIWDLRQGTVLYSLYAHSNAGTTAVNFSLDGNYFASGGKDCIVNVWKTSNAPGLGEITLDSERVIESARDLSVKNNNFETGIPKEITNTIDKIVNQLDVVTKTLVLLEQRVSKFENHINFLSQTSKISPN